MNVCTLSHNIAYIITTLKYNSDVDANYRVTAGTIDKRLLEDAV